MPPQFGAQIIWYGTTLDVIADYLEKMEAEQLANAGGTRTPFAKPGSKAPFPAAGAPGAPAKPAAAPSAAKSA